MAAAGLIFEPSSSASSASAEIEEEEEEFFDAKNDAEEEDCVYVAVGKTESSMNALAWTLTNYAANPNTTIYLIHVFPERRHLPSPLGALRRRHKMNKLEERERRKALLQNYLDLCSSFKIQNKVDAVLIESARRHCENHPHPHSHAQHN